MNNKILIPAAALVAALGVTASTAGATGMDEDLVVFEDRSTVVETFVDVNDEGFSAGDTIVEYVSVVSPDSGEVAGRNVTRIQVVESRVAPSDDDPIGDFLFVLDCTTELEGGTITFHGAAEFAEFPESGLTFTVSGGTGEYAGTSGTVHITLAEIDGNTGPRLAFDLS